MNVGKWFWPLYLSILPLLVVALGAMIWAFMLDVKNGISDVKRDQDFNNAIQHEVIRILAEDPDTKEKDKEFLEDAFRPKRGYTINKNSTK